MSLDPFPVVAVFVAFSVAENALDSFVGIFLIEDEVAALLSFMSHFVTLVALGAFLLRTVHLRVALVSTGEAFEYVLTVRSQVVSQANIADFSQAKLFRMAQLSAVFTLLLTHAVKVPVRVVHWLSGLLRRILL